MNKAVTYLALPPDLSGPWAYGGKGRKTDWAKTDAQKSSLADKGDIILILSGENIRRYHLELPGLRGRELRSAIESYWPSESSCLPSSIAVAVPV